MSKTLEQLRRAVQGSPTGGAEYLPALYRYTLRTTCPVRKQEALQLIRQVVGADGNLLLCPRLRSLFANGQDSAPACAESQ